MKYFNIIFSIFLLFLIVNCKRNFQVRHHLVSVKIDTITFSSNGKNYSDYPSMMYSIAPTRSIAGMEVFGIRNNKSNSIDVYSVNKRSYLYSVPVFNDGPHRSYSSDVGYIFQIVDTNRYVIIDQMNLRASLIDKNGSIVQSSKFINPLGKRMHFISDLTKPLLSNNSFYLSLSSKTYFDNPNDPIIDSLRAIFKYNFIQNFSELIFKKTNVYTSSTGLFNTYPTCLSNFPALSEEAIYLSDCQNNYVYKFDIQTELLVDSFLIKSNYFDKVKPFYKKIKYSDLTLDDPNLNNEISNYVKKTSEYSTLFYDSKNNFLIRQTRLGITQSELEIDPYHFSFTFIVYDLKNRKTIGEVVINRKEFRQVNFLNGNSTSNGLLFEYREIQPHEDSLYFLSLNFEKNVN